MKKQRHNPLALTLAALAVSAAMQPAQAVELGPVRIDGFIRQHMSWNLDDPITAAGPAGASGDMSMNRTTLQLEWVADLPRDIAFVGVARANWEQRLGYLKDLEDLGAYGNEGVGDYYDDADIREAYLDIPIGDRTLLKLGKQQVAWGETDFFQAMDMVHGFDYTWRSFLEPANADLRKPLIMANAIIDVPEADGSLQLLFRPGWDDEEDIGNSYDIEGGRWASNPWKGVHFPTVDPYNYEHSEGDMDDPTYGIRWNGMWDDLGYSFAYLKTFNPDPVMNANPSFGGRAYKAEYGSDQASTIGEVIYPMIDMLGFTLNGYSSTGDFVWSTEFAYIKDAPFNYGGLGEGAAACNSLEHGFCGIEEKDVLRSMVRVDKNLGFAQSLLGAEKPAFFSMQLFDTWIMDFDKSDRLKVLVGQPELRKEHSTLLTTIFGLSYMNGRLTPELVAGFDLTYGGGFAVPSITYTIGNHWKVKGEFDLFWSDGTRENGAPVASNTDSSLFGWFEDNNQFAMTVTYQF